MLAPQESQGVHHIKHREPRGKQQNIKHRHEMTKVLAEVMFTITVVSKNQPRSKYLVNFLITSDMMAFVRYVILIATTSHASGYMMRVATFHSPFSTSEAQTCKRSVLGFGNPPKISEFHNVSVYGQNDPKQPRNNMDRGDKGYSMQYT